MWPYTVIKEALETTTTAHCRAVLLTYLFRVVEVVVDGEIFGICALDRFNSVFLEHISQWRSTLHPRQRWSNRQFLWESTSHLHLRCFACPSQWWSIYRPRRWRFAVLQDLVEVFKIFRQHKAGPTQSQLSRPMSSRHHISMEHRLRRKHLLLNSDSNAKKEKTNEE